MYRQQQRSSQPNSTVTVPTSTTLSGAKQKVSCSPKMSAASTPPPKRFQKICNPFEGALAERLHLPLIASPSLFQYRSRTPRLSSTQFEWDIEEVSQLKPANVEAHETQFSDSLDPEQESKAQLAISTFFKESNIVPSPVDCPLRNRRVVLSEIQAGTPISKRTTSKNSRDCEVQTELSLPLQLPAELELALRQYFQPHLALASNNSIHKKDSNDIFNNSMRRKLFDKHNINLVDEEEIAQQTCQINAHITPQAVQTVFAGRISDSSDSFGCLSPIRSLDGLIQGTPDDNNGQNSARKRKQILLQELDEMASPIMASSHLKNRLNKQICGESQEITLSGNMHCNFMPDGTSSPRLTLETTYCSIDQYVGRMRMNVSSQIIEKDLLSNGDDLDVENSEQKTDDEQNFDLQMSTQSLNCSSNSDTPRGHRRRQRSANRKNLSQTFNAKGKNWLVEDEPQQTEISKVRTENVVGQGVGLGFHRIDSGFNEISNISALVFPHDMPITGDKTNVCESMNATIGCCSTPSKRN